MDKIRFTDKNALIDAIEIGEDFVSVYCNSTEPGKEDSVQRKLFNKLQELTPVEGYHDPDKFHIGDHPRGSNWRVWEHKFGCHFHIVYGREVTLKDLKEIFKIMEKYDNETTKI